MPRLKVVPKELVFPDKSMSFARGFEAGECMALMRDDRNHELGLFTHVDNRETIRRCANFLDWEVLSFRPSEVTGFDITDLRRLRLKP